MIAWLPNVSLPVDTRLDVTLCASSFSPRCLGREHRHRSGMAVCLRLAIWSLVIVLAAGDNPCANSNNSDVSSVKECKYLSPCTKADVPAAESGYTIE